MKTDKEMAVVFKKAADFFDDLPESAEVNMWKMRQVCGSPACFGGWLAVLYDTEKAFRSTDHINKKTNPCRSFLDGADAFAVDLGFENLIQLKIWAENNPDIWGNNCEYDMFCSNKAFGFEEEAKITTKDISKHLYGVAERLAS